MRSASVLLEHLVLMLQNCFPSQQLSQCKQGDDQSSSECKQQQGYCGCVLRAMKSAIMVVTTRDQHSILTANFRLSLAATSALSWPSSNT
jgi:hypothetical protein